MRVGIFCPGPSLRQGGWNHLGAGHFDMTIAVNEAIKFVVADWWLSCGRETFRDVTPLLVPKGIFCPYNRKWLVEDYEGQSRPAPFYLHSLPIFSYDGVPGAKAFSGVTSVVIAMLFNPTAIETFGMDFTPEAEDPTRNLQRFIVEEARLKGQIANCEERGIEFIRHLPAEATCV